MCGSIVVTPETFFVIVGVCAPVLAVDVALGSRASAVWFPRTALMLLDGSICVLLLEVLISEWRSNLKLGTESEGKENGKSAFDGVWKGLTADVTRCP